MWKLYRWGSELILECAPQALARAVYARRPSIHLDDVFSGMDSRTASTVADRLIGREGLLRKQHVTVLLVTTNRT